MKRLFAVLLATLLITVATPTMAIEEPAYRVVRTIEDGDVRIEVREYAPYTVAEIEVDGPAGDAGGQAFPVLAGYIFGKNAGDRRMAMTAPVVQTAAPVPVPLSLPMTAPVIQSKARGDAPGRTVVQFVLPHGMTRATAPEPLDPRIHLRDVAEQRYAVIRYSGLWSDANYEEHLARLRAAIGTSDLRVIGEPLLSRYDPPFKPWFLRRNEIWLPIASP
jgi:hypothetical protein